MSVINPNEPEPEWVRCVDGSDTSHLTAGKVYQIERRDNAFVLIDKAWYAATRFVPASADEATVTIDVPVAWARYQVHGATTGITSLEVSEGDAVVRSSCRDKLAEIGLL